MKRQPKEGEEKQSETSKMELRSGKIKYQQDNQQLLRNQNWGRPKVSIKLVQCPESQFLREEVWSSLKQSLLKYYQKFELKNLFHSQLSPDKRSKEQREQDHARVSANLRSRNRRVKEEHLETFCWLTIYFAERYTIRHREQFYELMILLSEMNHEGVADRILTGQGFKCLKVEQMKEAQHKENLNVNLREFVKELEKELELFFG